MRNQIKEVSGQHILQVEALPTKGPKGHEGLNATDFSARRVTCHVRCYGKYTSQRRCRTFLKARNLLLPGWQKREQVFDIVNGFIPQGGGEMRARGCCYGNGVAHLLVTYKLEEVYSNRKVKLFNLAGFVNVQFEFSELQLNFPLCCKNVSLLKMILYAKKFEKQFV